MPTADEYILQSSMLSSEVERALFDPPGGFYAQLGTGEEGDLVSAAKAIAHHVGIPALQSGSYEWGLTMPPNAAGRIHIRPASHSRIQIPLFYVGKALCLGGILRTTDSSATAVHGIWREDKVENESLRMRRLLSSD